MVQESEKKAGDENIVRQPQELKNEVLIGHMGKDRVTTAMHRHDRVHKNK